LQHLVDTKATDTQFTGQLDAEIDATLTLLQKDEADIRLTGRRSGGLTYQCATFTVLYNYVGTLDGWNNCSSPYYQLFARAFVLASANQASNATFADASSALNEGACLDYDSSGQTIRSFDMSGGYTNQVFTVTYTTCTDYFTSGDAMQTAVVNGDYKTAFDTVATLGASNGYPSLGSVSCSSASVDSYSGSPEVVGGNTVDNCSDNDVNSAAYVTNVGYCAVIPVYFAINGNLPGTAADATNCSTVTYQLFARTFVLAIAGSTNASIVPLGNTCIRSELSGLDFLYLSSFAMSGQTVNTGGSVQQTGLYMYYTACTNYFSSASVFQSAIYAADFNSAFNANIDALQGQSLFPTITGNSSSATVDCVNFANATSSGGSSSGGSSSGGSSGGLIYQCATLTVAYSYTGTLPANVNNCSSADYQLFARAFVLAAANQASNASFASSSTSPGSQDCLDYDSSGGLLQTFDAVGSFSNQVAYISYAVCTSGFASSTALRTAVVNGDYKTAFDTVATLAASNGYPSLGSVSCSSATVSGVAVTTTTNTDTFDSTVGPDYCSDAGANNATSSGNGVCALIPVYFGWDGNLPGTAADATNCSTATYQLFARTFVLAIEGSTNASLVPLGNGCVTSELKGQYLTSFAMTGQTVSDGASGLYIYYSACTNYFASASAFQSAIYAADFQSAFNANVEAVDDSGSSVFPYVDANCTLANVDCVSFSTGISTTSVSQTITYELTSVPTTLSSDLSDCTNSNYQTFMKTYFSGLSASGLSVTVSNDTSTSCKPSEVSSLAMSQSSRRESASLGYSWSSSSLSSSDASSAASALSANSASLVSYLNSYSSTYGASLSATGASASSAQVSSSSGSSGDTKYSGFGYGQIAAIAGCLGTVALVLVIVGYVMMAPDGKKVVVKTDDGTAVQY
jgi:hypothetical protein